MGFRNRLRKKTSPYGFELVPSGKMGVTTEAPYPKTSIFRVFFSLSASPALRDNACMEASHPARLSDPLEPGESENDPLLEQPPTSENPVGSDYMSTTHAQKTFLVIINPVSGTVSSPSKACCSLGGHRDRRLASGRALRMSSITPIEPARCLPSPRDVLHARG